MALTPEDVVNKRFQPTKFREGYDQDEVDDFLDEIVVELRRPEPGKRRAAQEARRSRFRHGRQLRCCSPRRGKGAGTRQGRKGRPRQGRSRGQGRRSRQEEGSREGSRPRSRPVPAAATASAESAAGLLAMAQQMHDKHVADGEQQRDKIIAEAQIEASSLVNDAQEKSRKILGALEQQRSVLERKVEQLRGFERDYRSRLKAYIEGQLRDLDAVVRWRPRGRSQLGHLASILKAGG